MKICVLRVVTVLIFTSHQICCTFGESSKAEYNPVQRLKDLEDGVRHSQKLKNIDFQIEKNKNVESFKLDSFYSLLNAFNNVSNSSCIRDLLYVARSLKTKDLMSSWAWKMLDSFGKPESGFLNGNLKWVGDFDECRNAYAPKNSSEVGGFHGKYCSLQVNMSVIAATIGICLPETCSSSDFIHGKLSTPGLYSEISSIISVNSLICKENTRHLSNGAIATICVLSIFTFFTILGSFITMVKYFTSSTSRNSSESKAASLNSDPPKEILNDDLDEPLIITEGSRTRLSVFVEGCLSFLNCFCIFTNGSKLLNVDSTEGQLLCLHGIRFLSMSWVIVCHMYGTVILVLRNFGNLPNEVDTFPFEVILNGFYSVDSFFLLSGFLLSYLYFEEAAKRKGEIPWLYFYLHRYIRLTPVYMIVLAFYATLYPYLGSGPFWVDYDVDPTCTKSWWWNLLYINNFQEMGDMCLGWSWYLANDMQFFVISPIFLISLWRWPKFGFTLLGLFLWANWITCFFLTYHYELITGSFSNIIKVGTDPLFIQKIGDYFDKIYLKPYARDAPYLIGIALGYIYFKKKITNFKLNMASLWIGWSVAIPLGLTCVYGLYHTTPGLLATSFYNGLMRTCYSLCLGWVIFVCLSGQAEVVNKILSYKLFIPLSRLTYCAYLIHLIVIQTYIGSQKATLAITHSTVVVLFLGLILITYALSLVVSLIFESPLIRLEKLIRSKPKT